MIRLLRKFWRVARHRYLLSFALVGALVALGLDLSGRDTLAHWVLIVVMIGELIPLLWGMVQAIREGTYGVDILAATAIITAVIMHEYWAGIVIVLMLTGGESLEDYAEHRASRELDALLTRAPQKARVLRGQQEVTVKASEVRSGDLIVIRPGDVVPVDALITEGASSVDESSLTGESLPAVKKVGDLILSGSVNIEGRLVARATATAADSQYEQIIKLVRRATKSKAPFVRLADRYAVPFTIISFGIAGMAWAFSGESIRFLEVLVVATPCPLILAAPIAIISGMSRAARQGIIVKTGSALEQLAAARTFAFDKTGTLTKGKPVVDSIEVFPGFSQKEVLMFTAALEQNSSHVLAEAILERAKESDIKPPKAKQIRELAGSGLEARISGHSVLVGRPSLIADYNLTLPKQFDPKRFQSTAALVAIDGVLAGLITFRDEIRPEAKKTLGRLRNLGVAHLCMVTGDSRTAAKTIAGKLGIKTFFAEALPGDKIRAVEQAERPVAFVGDGVNDAPVLMASDVGIALGARGSTAASESADIVIMPDDLSHVATGRRIAMRSFFIAKQSIWVGIGLSIVLMGIFATGRFRPIYGAVIQEVVDIVVIANALRAHGRWSRAPRKPTAAHGD